jgi:DNA modification methylase
VAFKGGIVNVLAQELGDGWVAFNADSVEALCSLESESIGLSVFSPPYLSLYVYSAHQRDLGNCRNEREFWQHYGYILNELLRVTKPGRIVAVDCMNVPAMKERDGYIGLKDFRGELIRRHVAAGFIFHSEHCAWKDPLLEATRTKALGLMHKQLCKDSTMSRAGIPQYLLAFRKPGVNPEPVAHPNGLEWFTGEDAPTTGNLSHERWRRYASPVWTDIDFTNTLNVQAARSPEDERHVCPMSLDMIDRGLELWSNPGDVVLSPFMGIGSEGYAALRRGRRFVGCELKESYFRQAVKNLSVANKQISLLDYVGAAQ